jgi:hypothetical protein
MSELVLKDLNYSRFRNWLRRADDGKNDDPIDAFISAWISFNHYYSTFTSENQNDFQNWSREHFNNWTEDKAQWLFLIQNKQFDEFFADYKAKCPECFEIPVRLPVMNMLNNRPVPQDIQGEYKLKDLTTEQIFLTIY